MTREANGPNGSPWWLKLLLSQGLAVFLLLWILGAMPFLPNPMWSQVHAAIDKHDKVTAELLRVQRLTCAASWRTEPAVQRECWRAEP